MAVEDDEARKQQEIERITQKYGLGAIGREAVESMMEPPVMGKLSVEERVTNAEDIAKIMQIYEGNKQT